MSFAAILQIIEQALGIVLPEAEKVVADVESAGGDSTAQSAQLAHLRDAHAAVKRAQAAAPPSDAPAVQ